MRIPLIENVIWTLVIILVIVIVILVFYLKIVRVNIRDQERNKQKYTSSVEQLLITFLYSEEEGVALTLDQKVIVTKFTKGLNSKFKRNIITATFIKLGQEVSGHMVFTMHKLYREIGMLKFVYKKLRSKKWHVIATGIRDARNFKIKEVAEKITKYINHPKEEVRREAHLYFLELFGFEGLSFLDNLQVPLSEWDQIQLLSKIEHFGEHEILDLTKWLVSENEYVVIFVLRLVKYFNKLENKNILLDLLDSTNLEIRLKAIEILTHFEISEAKELLKRKKEVLTLKEKRAFFNLIEKTAIKEDTIFVIDYISDEDFEVKHKALKILKDIDINLYNKLEKVSDDASYNKIIHFLDFSHGC